MAEPHHRLPRQAPRLTASPRESVTARRRTREQGPAAHAAHAAAGASQNPPEPRLHAWRHEGTGQAVRVPARDVVRARHRLPQRVRREARIPRLSAVGDHSQPAGSQHPGMAGALLPQPRPGRAWRPEARPRALPPIGVRAAAGWSVGPVCKVAWGMPKAQLNGPPAPPHSAGAATTTAPAASRRPTFGKMGTRSNVALGTGPRRNLPPTTGCRPPDPPRRRVRQAGPSGTITARTRTSWQRVSHGVAPCSRRPRETRGGGDQQGVLVDGAESTVRVAFAVRRVGRDSRVAGTRSSAPRKK